MPADLATSSEGNLLRRPPESALPLPGSVRSVLTVRDAVGGMLVGLVATVAVFLGWSPPGPVYRSTWVQLAHCGIVAVRGLFLAEYGIVLLVLAVAAGFVGLAVSVLLGRLPNAGRDALDQ